MTLIHAALTNESHLSHHQLIEVSTYGIIFLGTPNHGGHRSRFTSSSNPVYLLTNKRNSYSEPPERFGIPAVTTAQVSQARNTCEDKTAALTAPH